jgi:hypothetical protein
MYSTLKRLAFGIWFPARGYRKNGLAKGISVGVLRLKFGIKLGAEVRNLRKVEVWQGQWAVKVQPEEKKKDFKKQ